MSPSTFAAEFESIYPAVAGGWRAVLTKIHTMLRELLCAVTSRAPPEVRRQANCLSAGLVLFSVAVYDSKPTLFASNPAAAHHRNRALSLLKPWICRNVCLCAAALLVAGHSFDLRSSIPPRFLYWARG